LLCSAVMIGCSWLPRDELCGSVGDT
jgi:hypothetical protein